MSKSIRLSDELFEQAKAHAALFHRSPPQQIEHWAQIGRVMESALSYKAQVNISTWGNAEDIDQLIEDVASPSAKERTKKMIRESSGPQPSKQN